MANTCITPGCGKPSTLRCPKCLQLGITTSYFCSQECFKEFWKTHKLVHLAASSLFSDDITEDDTFAGFAFTGPLRPGKKTQMRTVPPSIKRPDYAETGVPLSEREAKGSHMIETLDDEAFEGMRLTSRACIERDCYPSPLNYFNFPKSCCTSINEVICHGIPDMRPLEDGDILNLDITTYHNGFHGDVNETVFVGRPDERSIRLVKTTYNSLAKAMDAVRPGVKYREIGDIITKQAASGGFSVVRSYSGHGVHRLFHCPPNVPHYAHNKAVGVIKPRHSFTIEPMINEGSWRDELWPDRWTAVTRDGLRSAQFEHTMLVLEPEMIDAQTGGCPIEVVTRRQIKGEDPLPSTLAIPDEDKHHYEHYGRPYFVDQLHKLGLDQWITA
ncbi:unnamed protein product [Calicophoron daubneyi]|uniref:Methionine aminopeptidase n=1 Tax=Calicophoron daubneyi TaxID=300641 RepID=A0AAV2TP62_CALDB